MPEATCHICGSCVAWAWEDAFDKFGFGDGDGVVMTADVIAVLDQAGYDAVSHKWGLHNEVIVSITKDGVEQIPATAQSGYDDPRQYLPASIIALLDAKFPEAGTAMPNTQESNDQ